MAGDDYSNGLASYVVHYGDMPKTASVSLAGVKQLIVNFSGGSGDIGLADITVK